MASKTKVELYAAIRRDSRAGLSNRGLQRKYGVGYRTVQKALASVWPEPRKALPRRRSRLDPYHSLIDGWLRADLDAPRKQRHTAKRVFDRLIEEHGAVEVSYGMVRAYVAARRPQIRIEAGRGAEMAFVPQSHRPGAEAEVDFGDVTVRLGGVQVVCFLFSLRLSYSGKAVHRVFASQGQEAFFEGHVHAFSVLGGVPVGKVRYDNLKTAVAQVLGFTRARVETERWTAFRSHWGIDSFYCRPGLVGAHEKGGVEGDIGYFRRNHLVPVPEVDTLAELNAKIDRWDLEDEARRIRGRASRSRPAGCSRCGWTATARSRCAPTATRCRCG
jgi:transposase